MRLGSRACEGPGPIASRHRRRTHLNLLMLPLQIVGPVSLLANQLHQQLRQALLSNIVHVYGKTGAPWESYDDNDGHGKGTHPFTGWTALFVIAASASHA